jgi:LPS-assembly protein
MPSTLFRAVAAVAAATLCGAEAWAQGQGLRLQRSIGAPPTGDELPAFVIADRLEGTAESELRAIGNAELRKGNTTLFADRIDYLVPSDEAEATGNVRLRMGEDQMSGPRLRLRLNDTTGIFESPTFQLGERQFSPVAMPAAGRGDAAALRFDGEDRYRITDGRFTTCKPGQDDWFVNARELDIDMQRQVGTARGASLSFLGVTTPTVPWFDFSMNNQRKTGFLPPYMGFGKNGFQFATPFYWNIAPEYDATITPRYLSQRGLQMLGDFRYLQPTYNGILRGEVLPNDRETDTTRWAYTVLHNYVNSPSGWSGLVNWQRASDDNYFRDLSTRLSVATQLYLPGEAYLNYSSARGGAWNVMGRVQSWQTLQDPQNPVQVPYNRLPQFIGNYYRADIGPLDANAYGEWVAFDINESNLPASQGIVPTGRRGIAYPSLSLPLVRPGWFITPKVGYHFTQYSLSNLTDPNQPTSVTRTLPIASVNSGLFFERDTRAFGRDFIQTLEPRAYYLYVPYRNQSNIPLFDTAIADFNYAQIFSENYYSGPDRISDANQLTLAVTSRMILPSNGQEILRGIFGQQYFFQNQQVALNSTTPTREGINSPFILGLYGRVAENWTTSMTVQYAFSNNATEDGLQRANLGVRYSPEIAKIINAGYRYTAPGIGGTSQEIRQVDVSGQWPMGGGFYAVGRYNYDLFGGQATEVLAGVEYNAGCWIVRAVAQNFVTSSNTRTNLFFIQLEFNGFSRLGSNPLEALRRNIPGYTQLGRPATAPRPYSIDRIDGSMMPYGGTTNLPSEF